MCWNSASVISPRWLRSSSRQYGLRSGICPSRSSMRAYALSKLKRWPGPVSSSSTIGLFIFISDLEQAPRPREQALRQQQHEHLGRVDTLLKQFPEICERARAARTEDRTWDVSTAEREARMLSREFDRRTRTRGKRGSAASCRGHLSDNAPGEEGDIRMRHSRGAQICTTSLGATRCMRVA
jgi:hypothetical protein